jgi:uncharacterized protein YjiS (DUF1127 family)
METTMNMHFDLEPPPLSTDAYLQARSRRGRTFGKSIRRGVGWIAGSMRRAWETAGIWLVRRHVMRELQMLDDHMLADIGVGRSEIERTVRHGHPRRRFISQ